MKLALSCTKDDNPDDSVVIPAKSRNISQKLTRSLELLGSEQNTRRIIMITVCLSEEDESLLASICSFMHEFGSNDSICLNIGNSSIKLMTHF